MKAIILDLDGVYFSIGTNNFIDAISRLGISKEKIIDIYLKSDMMKKYKSGLLDGKAFWDYAIKEWGLKKTRQEIFQILEDSYDLNTKKKEIMKILDQNNIKRIVCTNNFPERIKILDRRFDFLREFDYKIFSYEEHMLKPELLGVVSEKTGIRNEDILFLDDSKANIDYAESIGMNAILINEPTRVLKNLKEIFNK